MEVRDLHPWTVPLDEARRIQGELRSRLRTTDSLTLRDIHCVAGIDNSYVRGEAGSTAYAAVVTLSFPVLAPIDTAYGSAPVTFPYVPGLLSFREAPAILTALRGLPIEPDVILCDGHGYAHPRRFGLASHLGVVLDRPTIGCAKSKLVGRYEELGEEFGDRTPIVDRGEVIGAAVRTRPGHAPLFVSIGHALSLETAVEIVVACCRERRFMPEPTRLAHQMVTQYARERRDRGPAGGQPGE